MCVGHVPVDGVYELVLAEESEPLQEPFREDLPTSADPQDLEEEGKHRF